MTLDPEAIHVDSFSTTPDGPGDQPMVTPIIPIVIISVAYCGDLIAP